MVLFVHTHTLPPHPTNTSGAIEATAAGLGGAVDLVTITTTKEFSEMLYSLRTVESSKILPARVVHQIQGEAKNGLLCSLWQYFKITHRHKHTHIHQQRKLQLSGAWLQHHHGVHETIWGAVHICSNTFYLRQVIKWPAIHSFINASPLFTSIDELQGSCWEWASLLCLNLFLQSQTLGI